MPIAAAPASDEEIFNAMQRPMEPLIRKATEAAMEFTETLPDYVCQEMMARFQSERIRPVGSRSTWSAPTWSIAAARKNTATWPSTASR